MSPGKSRLAEDIKNRKLKKAIKLKKPINTHKSGLDRVHSDNIVNWDEVIGKLHTLHKYINQYSGIITTAKEVLKTNMLADETRLIMMEHVTQLSVDITEFYKRVSKINDDINHRGGKVTLNDIPEYYKIYSEIDIVMLDVNTVLSPGGTEISEILLGIKNIKEEKVTDE